MSRRYADESASRSPPCAQTYPEAPAKVVAGVAAGLQRPRPELRERQLAALSDTALDAHVADVLKLLADGLEVHFRLHGALGMVLGELAFTCQELLGWDETRIFSLLRGTSTTSTEPARALAHVAALVSQPVHALLKLGVPPRRCSPPTSSSRRRSLPTSETTAAALFRRTSLANRRWRSGRIWCWRWCATNWTAELTRRHSRSWPPAGRRRQ